MSAPVHFVELGVIDSTQRYAQGEVEAGRVGGRVGARPTVFVAEAQTAGVGQRGRAWSSPPGGLWMTLACPIGRSGLPSLLALRAGLAMLLAVRGVCGVPERRLNLKWPNDLMIDERKAGGALVEVVSGASGRTILVGIGINANVERLDLPENLRGSAITVREAMGHEVDLHALRTEVAGALLDQLLTAMPDEDVLAHVRAALFGVGRVLNVTLPDGRALPAMIGGLERDGRLRVEVEGRQMLLTSAIVEH